MELVTPTGAALVAALADRFGPLPRDDARSRSATAPARATSKALPNVVRAIIGTEATTGTVVADRGQPRRPDPRARAGRRRRLLRRRRARRLDHARADEARPPGVRHVRARPPRPTSARCRGDAARDEHARRPHRAPRPHRAANATHVTVEVGGEPVRIKVGRLDGKVVNLAPEHADVRARRPHHGRAGQDRLGARDERGPCPNLKRLRRPGPRVASRARRRRRRVLRRRRLVASSPRSPYRALGDQALAVTAVSPVRRHRRARRRAARRRAHRHRATRSSAPTSSPAPATAPTAATAATSARPSSTTRSPRATRASPLLSGANADDQGDWRPGLKAARRARRRPPADRRHQGAGPRARASCCSCPSAEKPASPCLASRIPYGTARRPRDARADRPRRAAVQGARLPRRCASATSASSAASRSRRRPRPRARQRARRSTAAIKRAGYEHAVIDRKPFRSGRLNVEPARPAASR